MPPESSMYVRQAFIPCKKGPGKLWHRNANTSSVPFLEKHAEPTKAARQAITSHLSLSNHALGNDDIKDSVHQEISLHFILKMLTYFKGVWL
jgi:hypothetical protein